MSIVSNNIKYLRRLNGLTQEQFARKIGIKRSLLGAYEEARANPNLINLKNMAHAFGISVDQLLKNDLRKIRETPNLGLPYNQDSYSPQSPLLNDTAIQQPPQPLAAVIARFQPPRPTLRTVARPIALKPIHQPNPTLPSPHSQSVSSATMEPMRFNNHFESPPIATQTAAKDSPTNHQTIQWVRQSQTEQYLNNHQNTSFLASLPVFQLPNLPSGHYRAFEAGLDFTFPGALLVGTFIRNWYDIKDNVLYVFILRKHGIVCRRALNLVKTKGILVLNSDVASALPIEISIKEVLEVWEINAFISQTLPVPTPSAPKLKSLLEDLREELNRTDFGQNLLM
ncbi:helix-turn-helix transcriptional regulator [Arundinibacter roseus]|uniref:XRE family transcriptional regulator n=1 Tax=Arundinibacter roseus TaxID=2070510 RepID=A0A4R4KGD0_9BACT|nr:helix-turn-helix transcriptional regulator [Arundinibacter roseus]TDB67048.1 XRE family transcriptional regulator [Arundinibacter roseus]